MEALVAGTCGWGGVREGEGGERWVAGVGPEGGKERLCAQE